MILVKQEQEAGPAISTITLRDIVNNINYFLKLTNISL